MSKNVRQPMRPFPIQLNPAALRQTGARKAAGPETEGRSAPTRAMPNGDPHPLMLWGAEKG